MITDLLDIKSLIYIFIKNISVICCFINVIDFIQISE